MKLFWMKLEVGEYLSKTSHLTTVEHGAYLLLLLHYWINGGLPRDEESIFRITRMDAKQWKKSKCVLKALFDESWRHAELDEKREQAIEKSQINSANAKRSHANRRNIAPEFAERSHGELESEKEAEPQSVLEQQRASASQQQPKRGSGASDPGPLEKGAHPDELADFVCQIAGLQLTEGAQAVVREWRTKNWDPTLICDVVEGLVRRSSGKRPRTLRYFEDAIRDAHVRCGMAWDKENPLN